MVTLELIKNLREETGASISDCKKVLEETHSDIEKAKNILQARGAMIAKKKAERQTKEGFIGIYIHSNGKIGSMAEIYCETDFVARNPAFKELAHNIAMHIVAANPLYLSIEQIPEEILNDEKKIYYEEFIKTGKPNDLVEKMVSGKIKKHSEEICLLTQSFIKDQDKTINEVINEAIAKFGENIKVGRFIRFEI